MQSAHLQGRLQTNRRGIVLLVILLLIVIFGVLIYFFGVRISPMDSETARQQQESPDEYPWVEEWRIKGSRMRKGRNVAEQVVSAEQANITRVLKFIADVKHQRDNRGQIMLAIYPDGNVEGRWATDYETGSPRANHLISASFQGNTDPSKFYEDVNGEDRSKLFLIAMGGYSELETNFETSKVRRLRGNIYVTGWINPDYSVTGKITITPDKKSLRAFHW